MYNNQNGYGIVHVATLTHITPLCPSASLPPKKQNPPCVFQQTIVFCRVVHDVHHLRVDRPCPCRPDGVVPPLPDAPQELRVPPGLHPAGQVGLAVLTGADGGRDVAHRGGVVEAVQLLLGGFEGPCETKTNLTLVKHVY